jgi:hypothetical protein
MMRIPPRFDKVYGFYDNRAAVEAQERFGDIDTQEEEIFTLRFGMALRFFHDKQLRFSVAGKWRIIDGQGKEIVTPRFDVLGRFFADGMTVVYLDGKWGFIDERGKEVVPPCFDNQPDYRYNGGLAKVTRDGKRHYINREGRVVLTLERLHDSEVLKDTQGKILLDETNCHKSKIARLAQKSFLRHQDAARHGRQRGIKCRYVHSALSLLSSAPQRQ